MGLLTGAAGAAAVIAGIFAGILADRLDRWILMAACDLARMLLYGLIPLVWSVHPEVWLLYVILPLCAALGMIFQVGYVTVVPALSGPARITGTNGLLCASSTAAIVGPLLVSLLSAALGPASAIAVERSFSFSAVGVLLIRRVSVSRSATQSAVSGPRRGWLLSTSDGHGPPQLNLTESPWRKCWLTRFCGMWCELAVLLTFLSLPEGCRTSDFLNTIWGRGRREGGASSLRSAPDQGAGGVRAGDGGLVRAGLGPCCCAGSPGAWGDRSVPPPLPPFTWAAAW